MRAALKDRTYLFFYEKLENSWRLTTALIFFIMVVVWASTCGLWDLRGADEGRYALVGKELLGRSNWFLLTLHGQPYDQKPPLPFWIFAGMTALNRGEISAGLLRLPSIFFGFVALLATYWIGRVRLGKAAGLVSALVLMTSAQFMDDAPTVELNMMFTGWIALALAAWLTRPELERMSVRRAVWMWGAIAGAFFTKGPLALIILLATMVAEAVSARSWKVFRAGWPFAGLSVTLLLIGGWLWAQALSVGGDFVQNQVQGQTLDRFLHGSHEEPFWYYLPRLFTSIFAPWGILLIPAGWILWKQRARRPRALDPIWGMVVFVFLFMCMASGKRQSYLTPLLPGFSLIVGWFLTREGWKEARHPKWAGLLRGVGFFAAAVLAGGGALLFFRMDWAWAREFYVVKSHLGIMIGLGLTGLVAAALSRFYSATRPQVLGAAWLFMLALGVLNFVVLKPAHNPNSTTRVFANQLEGLIKAHGVEPVVFAIGKAEKPEYHVYGHYQIRPVDDREFRMNPRMADGHLVLARRNDWEDVREAAEAGGFQRVEAMMATEDELVAAVQVRDTATDPNPEMVKLAVLGDAGTGTDAVHALAARITKEHEANPFDAAILLGDNIYGHESFQDSVKDRFEKPFEPLLEQGVPFFAALGNHDHQAGRAEEEMLYKPFHMAGRRYYKQTFGDEALTLFVLDSEHLKDDPSQMAWFRAALGSCESVWKILVLHHPMQGSDYSHGADRELYRLLKPVMTGEKDVDLVLSGHNHIYERRKVVDGILHLTLGCSGQSEIERLPEDPNRASGLVGRLAFAALEIQGDRMRVRVIDENGDVADEFEAIDTENPPMVQVSAAF